jgi:hypothetical protein
VRLQATVSEHRFHARDLQLVAAPFVRVEAVQLHVARRSQPPGAAHGIDANGRGDGWVTQPRLDRLRQPDAVYRLDLRDHFLRAGLGIYAFTFC